MNISMSRQELEQLAQGTVPDEIKAKAEQIQQEFAQVLTLGDLFPIGLADGVNEEVRRRFAIWKDCDVTVYPSEAVARETCPRTFRDVCTEWGRAGCVHREYPLRDGRVVVKQGCWWVVPEPGGSDTVFYLRQRERVG